MRDDERTIVVSLNREAGRAPSVEGPPPEVIRRVKRRRVARATMFTVSVGTVVGVAAVALVALSPLADRRSGVGAEFGPVSRHGITLLRHDLGPEDISSPGIAQGEIGLLNGCVAMGLSGEDQASFEASASYLVWPAGFDIRLEGSTVEILDASGAPVGRIGDRVQLDAHRYGLADAEEHAEIPEACRQRGTEAPTDNWLFVRQS